MMKLHPTEKKQWRWLLVAVFLLWLVIHYWDQGVGIAQLALSAVSPLLVGLVIAYLVNIVMSSLEKHFAPRSKKPWVRRLRRPCAMLLSFLHVLGVLTALVYLILPELWRCVELLGSQLPGLLSELTAFVREKLPDTLFEQPEVQAALEQAGSWLLSVAGQMLNGLIGGIGSTISSIATLFISLVMCIHLLLGKEKLLGQADRLMKLYLPEKLGRSLRHIAQTANDSFHRYIVGQCTEAVVLGTLCALGMWLFKLPYAVMIGSVVGVTALIPFVGAYLGAGIGMVMIFTVSPIKALIFLIYLVILQQLENNLIYPRVVGSSLGLPAIWVLTGVTLGGGLGGVFGMILGVPLVATAYQLIRHDAARREQTVLQGEEPHA